MNLRQKLRMLELLNEMQTILLEDINSSGAASASTPLPPRDVAHQASMPTLQLKFSEVVQPQDGTPQVDALALVCQKLDQDILSEWGAEEAQGTPNRYEKAMKNWSLGR